HLRLRRGQLSLRDGRRTAARVRRLIHDGAQRRPVYPDRQNKEALMDLRKIKKLIDLLEESNLAEIEIKEGEESVRLSRAPVGAFAQIAAPAPAVIAAP